LRKSVIVGKKRGVDREGRFTLNEKKQKKREEAADGQRVKRRGATWTS